MSKCKESISSNKLLVAAIEFGTTYSAYAFSFRHDFERDPLKISINAAWSPSRGQNMQRKVPTTLLLKPDKSFDSFGYDATDKYCDLADNEEHHDWYFFEHFKMLLDNKLELKRDTHIQDAMGKEMPAKTIFAIAIRFIKNHLLQMIQARGIEFYEDDIFWVLTIPAIWDEPAKQLMREAATEAGIKSDQFKLALEPEAFSVYCKTVTYERMQGEDGQTDTLGPSGPSTIYLFLYIGDCTLDVTAHEVMANGKLKELHVASGGVWGGTSRVDASYFELFNNLFGRELMENFKKENKYEFLDMKRDFETKIRTVKEESARVNIHVPGAFVEYVKETLGMSPQDIVNRKNMTDKLTFGRDRIMFQGSVIKEMFDPSIQSIVDRVKEVIDSLKVQRFDKILIGGDFSAWPFVQKAVEAAFSDIQVDILDDPGFGVVKGAVIFGHSPQDISSRITRYTYGVAVQGKFYDGYHPKEKRVKIGDEYFCKDLFSKFFEIDADAGEQKVIKRKYDITERDKSLAIAVYVSTKAYPILCTEDGCTKLGEIVIKVPMGGWQANAEVEVGCGLGGTEFIVKATEVNTQIDLEVKFDFSLLK